MDDVFFVRLEGVPAGRYRDLAKAVLAGLGWGGVILQSAPYGCLDTLFINKRSETVRLMHLGDWRGVYSYREICIPRSIV